MNKWSNYGKWRHPQQWKKCMNKLDLNYQNLLQDIIDNGVEKQDRTGTGTISVFGRQIRHDMKDGFPLLTTKKMAWKTMVTELLWFLKGDTNIKYLVDNNCHIWTGDAKKRYDEHFKKYWGEKEGRESKFQPISTKEFEKRILTDGDFAKKFGELGPIYGYQWRNWNDEIDQISDLIKQLKENPDSRRLLVSAWNPSDLTQQVLPPCHYGFQVYTRELNLDERIDHYNDSRIPMNRSTDYFHEHMDDYGVPRRAISLMWNQRSVDTFLGLPFNIASYGLLLTMLADEVNMVPDQLIGNLGDVHLYSNHIEQAKEQITREGYPLPQVQIQDGIYSNMSGDIKLVNYKSHPTIKAPLSN